jgi:rare lipoprotein A
VNQLRILGLLILLALLSACATRPSGSKPTAQAPSRPIPQIGKPLPGDGPPIEAYDLSKVREPTPRHEPHARYGNHSPYKVFGKEYRVLTSRDGYVERGIASWYGRKFHGNLTSSREPYDMLEMTAAHKTLPLPSYARVTNLSNGKSVVVRINDRGPFKDNRIIDLSFAAAVKLGVKQTGTAPVEVRVIVPGTWPDLGPRAAFEDAGAARPVATAPPVLPPPLPETQVVEPSIYLQIGAFASRDNAEAQRRRLLSGNVFPAFVDQVDTGRGPVHRVRVGPLESVELADQFTAEIEALGFDAPQLILQ